MITVINPNLLVQRNDPFTTGIVYMPIGLAYAVASLRQAGHPVEVLDAFGTAPRKARKTDRFLFLGLDPGEVANQIRPTTRIVFLYANQLTNHLSLVEIMRAVRARYPSLPIVVLENTQAVTAYALRFVANELFSAGADYLLRGEPEHRIVKMAGALTQSAHTSLHDIPGIMARDFTTGDPPVIENLDELPLPAWDLFPLENYWKLRFAHGPLFTGRYLPLLTSRGCPYACRFCVTPETNHRRWRSRSARHVVDEMEHWHKALGVSEFHWEDLNPTVDENRIREICREIMKRGLRVRWALAAGTKAETLKQDDTIPLMARAGCRYISISPESGSARVLEDMNKPVRLDHMADLVKQMARVGIRSQSCFVLGFPGETRADRLQTRRLVRALTRAGVDEIALFIITPVPGSEIYESLQGYRSLSELNFTPVWRSDYAELNRFRLGTYALFLWWKFLYHPLRFLRQPVNFMRRRFETKMEMVPYRAWVWKRLEWTAQ